MSKDEARVLFALMYTWLFRLQFCWLMCISNRARARIEHDIRQHEVEGPDPVAANARVRSNLYKSSLTNPPPSNPQPSECRTLPECLSDNLEFWEGFCEN